MNFIMQRTINKEIGFKGIGVHTGEISRVVIKPAKPNTGIVFVKLPEDVPIRAKVENLAENNYSTTIGKDNVKIATVEHLMASFFGLGIDNAIVYVTGNEIPIIDGSSKFFLNMMAKIVKELDKEKNLAIIDERINFSIFDRFIEYEPNYDLIINYHMAYLNYPLLNQKMQYVHSMDMFKVIAPSKTFVRYEDLKNINGLGLGKGITLGRNTRLAKKNSNGDFISHKILDLLGDLYLLGAPLIGKINCYKGGHLLNAEFAKRAAGKISFVKASKIIEKGSRL